MYTMGSNSEDIFVKICDQDLPKYLKAAEKYLPNYLRGWRFLENQINWNRKIQSTWNIIDKCKSTLYTIRNSPMDQCIFIAISASKEKYMYVVFVSAPEEYANKLNVALRQTKLIEWKSSPSMVAITEAHYTTFDQISKANKVVKQFFIENFIYRLPRDKALKFDYSIPSEFEIKQLDESHAGTINEIYPHRNTCSLSFIQNIIKLNWGLGLFRKCDNHLLSWALKNEIGVIGYFQTISSETGKGYGKLILKAFIKTQAECEAGDILAYVIVTNVPSNHLFKKLGFEIIGKCAWTK